MKNIHFKLRALDLHGIKHSDVIIELENYVYPAHHQNCFPIQIITGNSDKMRKIVIDFLNKNNYKYKIGDNSNNGYIVVLK